MRVAIGSDEHTAVTDAIVAKVEEMGHSVTTYGPLRGEAQVWSVVARDVAEAVATGSADEGILFCWTGTGVSLAANKVPTIRAALCADAETARGARLWNNANVLCLSLRLTSEIVAKEIIDAWFAHAYVPNEGDDACLAEIEALETAYARNA